VQSAKLLSHQQIQKESKQKKKELLFNVSSSLLSSFNFGPRLSTAHALKLEGYIRISENTVKQNSKRLTTLKKRAFKRYNNFKGQFLITTLSLTN